MAFKTSDDPRLVPAYSVVEAAHYHFIGKEFDGHETVNHKKEEYSKVVDGVGVLLDFEARD